MWASLCELAQPGNWRLALPGVVAPGQHEQLRGSRGGGAGVGCDCASDKVIEHCGVYAHTCRHVHSTPLVVGWMMMNFIYALRFPYFCTEDVLLL